MRYSLKEVSYEANVFLGLTRDPHLVIQRYRYVSKLNGDGADSLFDRKLLGA